MCRLIAFRIADMTESNETRSLFSSVEEANLSSVAPLALRMRPRILDDFVGQSHFLGPDKLLSRMLRADRLTSLLFCGPPGVGKTSLARVIARQTKASFSALSAPSASVTDIRAIIASARDRLATGRGRTILFIDEIHRFNRGQQDVLLKDVEEGILILIGATTENPYFSLNSALVSRSTLFQFEPLNQEEVLNLLRVALTDTDRGLGKHRIEVDVAALRFLAVTCAGDARKALTALEVAVLSQGQTEPKQISLEVVKESMQRKAIPYDGTGDTHYDLASAFQKSMRGSDPDATLYWLARMIAGGEEVRFIARRIAVCAAEDVGNADPTATILAASAQQIAEFVGLPEAQLPLAQAAIYVACAPKSNASSAALFKALRAVENEPIKPVPLHLKDRHSTGAGKAGIAAEYRYPHDDPRGFVVQEYLPNHTETYYSPTDRGRERNIRLHLQSLQSLIQDQGRTDDHAGAQ